MNATDKQCPECNGAMNEIKIVDRIVEGMHVNLNNQLDYTAPDAKRSFWTGRLLIEGRIVSYMCADCGRVLLYGRPHDTK